MVAIYNLFIRANLIRWNLLKKGEKCFSTYQYLTKNVLHCDNIIWKHSTDATPTDF